MRSGGTTVLVVDDDASIRLLCRVNLELDGYRVLEAGTLSEARGVLADEQVALVLLDVHIAGRDGRELLSELRAERPEIAVVLLTGSVDADAARDRADAVIPKPFPPDRLTTVAAELIGSAIGAPADSRAP
jgi:DNA-binding NtrC family response regulator